VKKASVPMCCRCGVRFASVLGEDRRLHRVMLDGALCEECRVVVEASGVGNGAGPSVEVGTEWLEWTAPDGSWGYGGSPEFVRLLEDALAGVAQGGRRRRR
jgi:hypothetical protein